MNDTSALDCYLNKFNGRRHRRNSNNGINSDPPLDLSTPSPEINLSSKLPTNSSSSNTKITCKSSHAKTINNNNTSKPFNSLTMPILILQISIFIVGVLTSLLITLYYTTDIINTNKIRTFQPLPQLEHLQLRDEIQGSFNGFDPAADEIGECPGDNPLGKIT